MGQWALNRLACDQWIWGSIFSQGSWKDPLVALVTSNGDDMSLHIIKYHDISCYIYNTKQGHARCNGPAVFGCFARRPKSRFEDPYSTLAFFPSVHMFHFIGKLQGFRL